MGQAPVPKLDPEERLAVIEAKFVAVDPHTAACCVDGRSDPKDEIVRPHTLGGAIQAGVMVMMDMVQKGRTAEVKEKRFATILAETIQKLRENGYDIGIHTDTHNSGEDKCGCGYATVLGKVFEILSDDDQARKIWDSLQDVGAVTSSDNDIWGQVIDVSKQIHKMNQESQVIPEGPEILKAVRNTGEVNEQVLDGGHAEGIAVINERTGETLDTYNLVVEATAGDELKEDLYQAFDYDVWVVDKMAEDLGLDAKFQRIAGLAQYVATAIALDSKAQLVVRK